VALEEINLSKHESSFGRQGSLAASPRSDQQYTYSILETYREQNKPNHGQEPEVIHFGSLTGGRLHSTMFARHFTQSARVRKSMMARSIERLKARYPHISTPNLIASFLVLHEVTAIVPYIGFFALFSWPGLALGDRISKTFEKSDGMLHDWFEQGQDKIARVGRRYGWFGFEKGSKSTELQEEAAMLKATSAVTNAIASYLVVKALLPLRIGACFWLAPRLSNSVGRLFRGIGARWQARH
jgi:hypothetical protein